jgi:TPR repeat protein
MWQAKKVFQILFQIVSFCQDDIYAEYQRNPSLLDELARRNHQKALDFNVFSSSATMVNGVVQITNIDGLKNVADRGCALSQFQLSMYHRERSEFALFQKYIRLSADQGYLLAESKLGNCLLAGSSGFEQSVANAKEAFTWFSRIS